MRLGRNVNRQSFRAFLNGQEVTSKFARAGSLACTLVACDLAATVGPSDGLRTGRNELRVEIHGPGDVRNTETRIFNTVP